MTVGIVLQSPKTAENVASVLRLASCWGADLVATVGPQRIRAARHPMNTFRTEREIPFLHFDTMADLAAAWVDHWAPIGVELAPGAVDLRSFVHPRDATYLFGPEDGSLSAAPIRLRATVQIPTSRCLNLAHAVGIVLYDRSFKDGAA